uniref:Uncharacterized protein n=1 Tax=Cannabis sativa TaxID=3483 RepID=A0A803PFP5_CANSA
MSDFSDTGIGSCLDEFFDLKLCSEDFGSEYWDGVLSVTTTNTRSEDSVGLSRLGLEWHCKASTGEVMGWNWGVLRIEVLVPPTRRKIQLDSNLTKKAVKLALDDLREKHTGVLLSAHALKICSHAPDLAKTMAGLILSSEDIDFQTECFSLLGLQSQDVEGETVEACINEKIISVIEMNDKKPQRSKDVAPFLFEDDCGFQEPGLEYDEYEGENAYSPMDIYN